MVSVWIGPLSEDPGESAKGVCRWVGSPKGAPHAQRLAGPKVGGRNKLRHPGRFGRRSAERGAWRMRQRCAIAALV